MIPLRFIAAQHIPPTQAGALPGHVCTALEGLRWEVNTKIKDTSDTIENIVTEINDAKSSYYTNLCPCAHGPDDIKRNIKTDLIKCTQDLYADYDDMMICRNQFTSDMLWSDNFFDMDWAIAKYLCCPISNMEFEEVWKMLLGVITAWEHAPPEFTPENYTTREYEIYDFIISYYSGIKYWAKVLDTYGPKPIQDVRKSGKVTVQLGTERIGGI